MKVHIGPFRKNRREHVQIDSYDTWSLDHTLAMVIHPALEAFLRHLKKCKVHGVPHSFFFPGEGGELGHYSEAEMEAADKRFKAALTEMVWCFREIATNNPGEKKFFKKAGKRKVEKTERGYHVLDTGYKVDSDGLAAYNKRIQDGIELFAKHFQELWC